MKLGRQTLTFNHIGVPTTRSFSGERRLEHLKMTVSDHRANAFGIQWQRFDDDAPYPDLVKTTAHVAFEVDDVYEAIKDQTVIIQPNSPSPGVIVAFIEVDGAPVELLSVDRLVSDEQI